MGVTFSPGTRVSMATAAGKAPKLFWWQWPWICAAAAAIGFSASLGFSRTRNSDSSRARSASAAGGLARQQSGEFVAQASAARRARCR